MTQKNQPCKRFSLLLLLLFMLGVKVYSIDHYLGANASAVYDFVNADLRQLPSVADSVPRYAAGQSLGYELSLFYELYISSKVLLKFGLGYTKSKTYYSSDFDSFVGPDSNLIKFHSIHNLFSNFSGYYFEPTIKFSPFSSKNFFLNAGVKLSYIPNYNFTRSETITSPDSFFFAGKNKTRLPDQGIESTNPYKISLIVGCAYDIMFDNSKYFLSPEISYSYGYCNPAKSFKVDINTLKLGLSFKVNLNPPPELEKPLALPIPETIPIKKDSVLPEKIVKQYPKYKLSIFGENDGLEVQNPTFRIFETVSSNIPPLLNYIFFDHNNSKLPDRYVCLLPNESNNFNLKSLLSSGTIKTYHNLLNIIALRMKNNPKAKLTIIGCNSGESESNNPSLSAERAETVANYLINIWNIQQNRLIIKSRNLPDKISRLSDSVSASENQRVELFSDQKEILEPVSLVDTSLSYNPAIIRLKIDRSDTDDLRSWSLNLKSSTSFIELARATSPTPLKFDIDFAKIGKIVRNKKALSFSLILNFNDGHQDTVSVHFADEFIKNENTQQNDAKIIEKYSLILFDFNSYTLSDQNNLILQYIRKKIDKPEKIYVHGYTDILGDTEYNLELSKKRAKQTANALISDKISQDIIEIQGYGSSMLLFTNELPEGRFYNRTVNIISISQPKK
ncbi:MAG: OmpA family protein [Candidatus Kapabacteria bacterium]|nr:OmpA family protein [Candidatus Kapabacteria bacterium]